MSNKNPKKKNILNTMIKKLPLKTKELKAVKEFKQQVVNKFGDQVLEMKLFGSKARGDSRKYSDIDIFVLLQSGGAKKKGLIHALAHNAFSKHYIDISPTIYFKKDYDYEAGLPSIFIQTMSRDAIDLK